MRNITDEQVDELARDITRDILDDGVELLTISESIDNFLFDADSEEDSTDEDLVAVRDRVDVLLTKLSTLIDNL